MLNLFRLTLQRTFFASILAACVTTICVEPASSQISPEIWGTVGAIDDLISYGAGARLNSIGIEIGTGKEGATGGDFLTFIRFPIISPYLGIGYYSVDDNIAFSGGAHLNVGGIFVIGGGYHSVRGPNGKLGLGLRF